MFDARFVRMWRLYLAGSIAAFTTGKLQLFQVVFAPGREQRHPLDARRHLRALSGRAAMRSCEVLIVGGGPAGSAAAWKLRRAGADVLVLDRERFPRLKLCAGWITPEVVRELEMDVRRVPAPPADLPAPAHALRPGAAAGAVRAAFDPPLRVRRLDARALRRAGRGAQRAAHRAPSGDGYLIDDAYRCRYLIGAGGTRCPVYRTLFRELNPRASELQLVTLEHEFEYDWQEKDCHLWFFGHGLPGYSWYVPKERGWLNVGVGGIAERMKSSGHDIRAHWGTSTQMLERQLRPRGALRPDRLQLLPARQRGHRAQRQRFHRPAMRQDLPPRTWARASVLRSAAACGRRQPSPTGPRIGWMM